MKATAQKTAHGWWPVIVHADGRREPIAYNLKTMRSACQEAKRLIDDRAKATAARAAPRWGVWCAVWGGVTGHREAWLKQNGKRMEFDTRGAAQAQADALMLGISPHSKAQFSYTAREIER